MPSKTSFFNSTIFWKNVRRFWPLWTLYLAIWCLMPLLILVNGNSPWFDRMDYREGLLQVAAYGGLASGAIVAIFSAMLVWHFLYTPRSAHGHACLPIRREGLFLTEMLSGLLPLLAANLIVAVLTLLAGIPSGAADFASAAEWFAVVSLILIFFYGFAAFCAQLTGHIVVLPLVYGVLNFVVCGAELLLRAVFGIFAYGMDLSNLSPFEMTTCRFSPVLGYLDAVEVKWEYPENWSEISQLENAREYASIRLEGWGMIVIYAIVGLVLLAGALLLFRRRKMESAGDVVAVGVLRPVFRWCMALGCALLLSLLLYAIFFTSGRYGKLLAFLWMLVFLMIGAFIGWFVAEMLMKKSFRVFSARRWGGLGVCAAVILVLMLGMRFDLFGYERRVPDASRIEYVFVQANGSVATLQEPENIELARQVHRQIIADKGWNDARGGYVIRDDDGTAWVNCVIRYSLTNGSTMTRSYSLRYEPGDWGWGSLRADSRGDMQALNALLNCPEAIAARKQGAFPVTRSNLYQGSVDTVLSAVECARLSGYDSPEEYILCDRMGWTRDDAARMDPLERETILAQAVYDEAANSGALYAEITGSDPNEEIQRGIYYEQRVEAIRGKIDYDRVLFDYSFPLEQRELWELYSTCILPDLADGTLGKVWVLTDDEYYDSVYRVTVRLNAREKDADLDLSVPDTPRASSSDGYFYTSFYTVPTVNSFRTTNWLRAHGIPLHLQKEFAQSDLGYAYGILA